jgi:hypothetical protein
MLLTNHIRKYVGYDELAEFSTTRMVIRTEDGDPVVDIRSLRRALFFEMLTSFDTENKRS